MGIRKHVFFHSSQKAKSNLLCVVFFLTKYKMHSYKFFLLLVCLMATFTQMIQCAYISAIMISLQNQFNLSSTNLVYILSTYDFMSVFSSPIVAYIGSRFNKPKIIGLFGFIYVIGAIIFTFPYYFTQKYEVNVNKNQLNNQSHLCADNRFSDIEFFPNLSNNITQNSKINISKETYDCQRDLSNMWPFYAFIASQILMSLGVSPLFSIGTTYLCDNLDAFYIGIFYSSYALGPAIGFLVASYSLSIWVNKFSETSAPINDDDSRWVGFWHLGFLISAGIMLIASVLMITFPEKILKNIKKNLKENRDLKKTSTQAINDVNLLAINDDSNLNVGLNYEKPRLEIIDENEEISEIVDKNFEFLNTISSRVVTNTNDNNILLKSKKFNKSISIDDSEASHDLVSAKVILKSQHSSSNSSNLNKVEICDKRSMTVFVSLKHKFAYFRLKLSGFLKCLLRIYLNYRYTLLILTISTDCILLSILINHLILYSQNSYQISSLKSNIIVGGVVVGGAIFGVIFGGFIVRKFNFNIEGCTRLIMFSSMFALAGIFALIFVKCDSNSLIGLDSINYGFNKTSKTCNKHCNCHSFYSPICGIDGITYISPCYVGCKRKLENGYAECSCLSFLGSNKTDKILAKPGVCSKQCNNTFVIFLIVLFIVTVTESMCTTPATILILKIIDKDMQSFALGLMKCVNTLIAFISAPLVFSKMINNTCILWKSKCVGDKDSCLEYENNQYHLILFGSSAGIKIISCSILIVFTLFIHKSYIRRRHYKGNLQLNHDATTILTARQKYMIDSEVASTSSKINNHESKKKTKKKAWIEAVVLKSQRSFDEFTSFDRSQTPDFFCSTKQI